MADNIVDIQSSSDEKKIVENNVEMIPIATNEDDNMMTDDDSNINNIVKPTKEHLSATKQHYQSLARNIIVYGRDGIDCNESIVVRDVYPDAKFNGFGVSGIANIETLFNVIIRLVCGQKDRFIQHCKYGKKEIVELVNMPSVQELLLSKFKEDVTFVDANDRCYIEFDDIRVYMWLPEAGKLAQISLFNMRDGKNGKCVNTGVYMFPSTLLKLLGYINTRFSLMDGNIPQAKYSTINQYDTDDFF